MQITGLQADDLRLKPLFLEIEQSLRQNLYDFESVLTTLKDLTENHQGLILGDSSTVYAFLIFHVKEPVCFIDFAFASAQTKEENFLYHLLDALLTLCRQDGQIKSVRCDFIPWYGHKLQKALVKAEFQHSPRLLLRAQGPFNLTETLSEQTEFLTWKTNFDNRGARLLKEIFANSEESKWDPVITERAGCLRFIADTYAGRFGIFEPSASYLLKYQNQDAGLALSSWNSEGNGFIAAFGVLPQYSGLGLGGRLLRRVLHSFDLAQAPAVDLAVSESNIAAMRLYKSQKFKTIDRVSLYYYNLNALN